MKDKFYSLRDVAKILGVSYRSIMNWEKLGKIPLPKRDPMSRYRLYSEADLAKLKKITGRG